MDALLHRTMCEELLCISILVYHDEDGNNKNNLLNIEKEVLVLRLRDEGCAYRLIRQQTGLALSTIRRIIVEQDVLIEV